MNFCRSSVVLDLVESGVIVLDQHRHIVYWNEFVRKCSDLKLDEQEEKTYTEVFPALKGSRVEKAINRALDNNFPSILSHKLLKVRLPLFRKSLASRPPYLIDQSLLIKPIIEDGENRGCIIYIDDVSANAKKERDLRIQSHQLKQLLRKYENVKSELESVFDNTTNGIILFDEHGVIKKANQSSAELFNLPNDQMIGRDIVELLPDMEKQFRCREAQKYQYEKYVENEYEQRFAGDEFRSLLVTFNPLNGEDQTQGFFVFINDISHIKTAEFRLRKANNELEEFAYRTSHDIRSPIVSSRALLQLAQRAMTSGNSERASVCLEQSINSLEKLEQLTIDITKLTLEDKQEESVEEVSLGRIVEDALEHACQLQGYEKIEKRIFLEHQGPLISKPVRMRNIVENLVSNAIKYYDPAELCPYLVIHTFDKDNTFYLEISDNGLGIPTEQRHKVFSMFKRFHPNIAFGSGLGLYLTQKSVRSIHGKISLLEKEKGTGFRLTIPRGELK